MNKLAMRIREERKRLGLTQAQLGEVLGRGGSTVRMWELGKSFPTYDLIEKMVSVFDVSYEYLLGRSDEKDSIDNGRFGIDLDEDYDEGLERLIYTQDLRDLQRRSQSTEELLQLYFYQIVGRMPTTRELKRFDKLARTFINKLE